MLIATPSWKCGTTKYFVKRLFNVQKYSVFVGHLDCHSSYFHRRLSAYIFRFLYYDPSFALIQSNTVEEA